MSVTNFLNCSFKFFLFSTENGTAKFLHIVSNIICLTNPTLTRVPCLVRGIASTFCTLDRSPSSYKVWSRSAHWCGLQQSSYTVTQTSTNTSATNLCTQVSLSTSRLITYPPQIMRSFNTFSISQGLNWITRTTSNFMLHFKIKKTFQTCFWLLLGFKDSARMRREGGGKKNNN